jgi:hypothetical protein
MFRERTAQGSRRGRRRTMGDQTTEMVNMMNEWNEMLYGPYMDAWENMMSPWMEAMDPSEVASRPRRRHQHRDCPKCGRDDCHCECCVYDADLAIYTRLGEQRVVPILIENSRRREREVKLELSQFSTHDKTAVTINGRILEPTSFTIKACDEQEVILVIQVLPQQDDNQPATGVFDRIREDTAAAGDDVPDRQRLPDVSECTTYYADLRVEGCDMRPVRIAVVVLPRDCDPFEIDCHCGCC